MEDITPNFEAWAVVELFGHTQLAGKVTTQTIASQEFVRIDVPKTSHCAAFTKYHLPTAVYGLTPVDQEYATLMAERLAAQPINDYKHNLVIEEIVATRLADEQKQLAGPESNKTYSTFSEWLVDFNAECKAQGYTGPINQMSFEDDFEQGNSPIATANEFVFEMNRD